MGCFPVAHGVNGVVEADVEEESQETEKMGVRARKVRMTRRKRAPRMRRRMKLTKDKVVDGRRGGIVDFIAAKPLPSLPWHQCKPRGTAA